MPFYGDELAAIVARLNAPLALGVSPKGGSPDPDDLRGEILLEIAAGRGVTDADIRRELGGVPAEKGPQNWEWVQAALRALDRVPGVNSKFIDLVTRDVYVYLDNNAARRKVDGIVQAAIADQPCVVIGHSLGSVVAYNVLSRLSTPAVPRLVTVGSPLGINGIKRKLDKPLRNPPGVSHWFNAFDERDVVALAPLDAKNFAITPSVENKNDVDNFTDNRHGIAGYLADPVVASKIVELLR
jgi:pimeloyl-ACP methyl ester carboxylesterase